MKALLIGGAGLFLPLLFVSCASSAEKQPAIPLFYTCPLTAKLRITQQFEFVNVPAGWRAFGTAASEIETMWQFDHVSSAGRIFCVYRRESAGGIETRHVYERDWPQGYACQPDEIQSNLTVCRPVESGTKKQLQPGRQ